MNPFKCWATVLVGILLLPKVAASADRGQGSIKRGFPVFDKEDYRRRDYRVYRSDSARPEKCQGVLQSGPCLWKKGSRQGLSDCNEAIRLDPKYAEPTAAGVSCYARKGQYERAIGDLNEAIRLDPQLARAYSNRGVVYGKKGDLNKAVADLNEAIRLTRRTPSRTASAASFGKNDQYDKAIADFSEGIRLSPKDARFYVSRGISYAGKGLHTRPSPTSTRPYNSIRKTPGFIHRGAIPTR